MIAQVLEQPAPAATGPLRLVERPDPEPAPGEVVVAVEACAVCRTDLQLAEGDLEARALPIVPGHQVVGTVVGAGPAVEGVAGVEVEPASLLGTRVGIAWIAGTCGSCRFCRRGAENLCEHATFTGWDRDGGYATAVTARADFVHPLPEGFDAVASAPLLCGGAIGLRALRVAGVDEATAPGMQVGLYGFGASATVAIQIARHWGAEVHVATRSEPEQARARAIGAVWAGPYDEPPPVRLDAAVTFAPAGDVVIHALEALDRGAAVAINAIHLDRIPAFSYDALWWERSLRSVANVTRADVRDLLALAVAVPITTQVERQPLAGASDALARLAAGEVSGAAVLTMDGAPGA